MSEVCLSGGIQLKKSVTVKFKKLSPEAVVPTYSKAGDAGADLTATSKTETDMYIEYGTGLAVEIPPGCVGYIFPRSSLSNYDLVLSNHVGVVDSNYRGEIKFRFKKIEKLEGPKYCAWDASKVYEVGDRIGQLIVMPVPTMTFEEVVELSSSERGDKAYGSSGK